MHTISEPHCSTQLQQDLSSLKLWCSTWKLSLNTSKCTSLRFSFSPQAVTTYFIDNQAIKTVKHHKGVLVTNNLTSSDHINYICSSAYRSFHLIRRSVSSSNQMLRKFFFFTLISSRLTYCSQVWKSFLIKDIICQRDFSDVQLSIFLMTTIKTIEQD